VAGQNNAELTISYLKKGAAVCVKVRLESRSYSVKDDQNRTATQLVAAIIISLDSQNGFESREITREGLEESGEIDEIDEIEELEELAGLDGELTWEEGKGL